jgi:ABC-type multidrug transport system ATPase subunit
MLYHMPVRLREQRIAGVLALVDLSDRQAGIVKHYSG